MRSCRKQLSMSLKRKQGYKRFEVNQIATNIQTTTQLGFEFQFKKKYLKEVVKNKKTDKIKENVERSCCRRTSIF